MNVIYGPATLFTSVRVPLPKRGGTFFYCECPAGHSVPKLDKRGRKTRYTEIVEAPCGKRFRRESTYRRHFRRMHPQGASARIDTYLGECYTKGTNHRVAPPERCAATKGS